MQYGVILPNVGPMADIDSLVRIAVRAEALGYDGVFLSDHIALPTELRSRYPYRSDGRFPLAAGDNILEPVTTLAYLAAVTDRIRLGFSVLVLPYRHPVLNAKMLGTLDVISGGRLIVGAGVGWMAEEFAALDVDYDARGTITDEHIAILRGFWTEESPNMQGDHYTVSGLGMAPRPPGASGPPIWTGGTSRPALRRAARLADGWHGVRQTPADVAGVVERISHLRAESGHGMHGFAISLRAGLDLVDEPLGGESRTPLRGSAAQITNDLHAYAEAGLTHVAVEPRSSSADELIDRLEQFAEIERP